MMEYEPYKLRNASEISSIKKSVEVALSHSFNEWEIGFSQIDYVIDVYDAYKRNSSFNENKESWVMYCGNDDKNWIILKQNEAVFHSINEELFYTCPNNSERVDSALFDGVIKSFLCDFVQMIFEKIDQSIDAPYSKKCVDFPKIKKGCGILKVDVKKGSMQLEMLVSENIVSEFVVENTRKLKDLVTYKSALESNNVLLSALLGNIKINIKELKELEEGDVLNVFKSVSEPVSIQVNEQEVCSAYLCQKNNMKSVQLISA